MDNYTIKHPFLGIEPVKGFLEVEIKSDNLIYAEIQSTHAGLQCRNMTNKDAILSKCKQVSDLIREIDKLNK